jgi:hypothetical protein
METTSGVIKYVRQGRLSVAFGYRARVKIRRIEEKFGCLRIERHGVSTRLRRHGLDGAKFAAGVFMKNVNASGAV